MATTDMQRIDSRMSRVPKTDPCAGEPACLVPPAEFVRLRYFFGQRLGVVDLVDEQSYFAGKLRFHNLRAHGVGVLCGLRAERFLIPQGSPPKTTTTLLRVHRGAALDWCGREIVVGWDQCIDVAAWFAQHPEAHPPAAGTGPVSLWVALCYRECPSDPAPAPRDPCGCDAGGCEFARIREGFELKLVTAAEAALIAAGAKGSPATAEPAPEETLGGSLAGALARQAALAAAADCPLPPDNPCLLLARFQAILDSAGAKVVDITDPDNAIPTRLTLLPTALLQAGLLEALAAAGDAELIGSGPNLSTVTFKNGGTDSGTLSVAIESHGADLSRDPITASPPIITISVTLFDGTDWKPAPAPAAKYIPPTTPTPASIDLVWNSGSGLAAGRYRVLIETSRAAPPVDTKMRPLVPPVWARHFRLDKDSFGNLVLAPSLF
jgi:hypothetical protein